MYRWGLTLLLGIALLPLMAAGPSREPVDILVSGGTVVTMDGGRHVVENGAVAIRGERIVAVGPAAELETRYQPARRIDATGELVLPGLINAHTHAAMSLYRGVADDVNLETWLYKFIFPLEHELTRADEVYWGTKLAELEMIRGGITTFVDMYYFEDQVARAAREAGMRAVAGETIIDFPAPDFATPADSLAFTEKFIHEWQGDSLVVPAVAPHSAYTCSAKTLKAAAALAKRTGAPLLIHLAESPGEMKTVRERSGTTTAQYLNELGVFEARTLGAHCIYVDAADRALLASKHVGCAHCPSSNMMIASGVAPVVDEREAGIAVGLGTDGPAGSNDDLDLMEEMDLAAKLQKVTRMDPKALTAPEVLAMATIDGARALGLEKEIGSLEPGKRADLIILRRDAPHAIPYYNAYSQIVYSLKASDVDTSIINGRMVMEHRKMLTLDEQAIRQKVAEYAARVRQVLAAKP